MLTRVLSSCSCPQLPERTEANISEWIKIPSKWWMWLHIKTEISVWRWRLWSRCSDGLQVRSIMWLGAE